ncbi:hypothetical protein O7635_05375 [Asanoa sp. WMMD1127]|uniref:hypothetical protein n=1 Tax=Asanoa sp. WMMD1127 TaxID=3016107 RepID=UPI002416A549|nr:hypothetical protein [Asanoa sp. WMMD1127]MDG4821283.1 hypothetical protein [Asanoa sp. WMMD1127]
MIELSDTATAVLAGPGIVRYLRVESWLGDELLADDVPVTSAVEVVDRAVAVPDRVTLTVPRLAGGRSWAPVGDRHPLGADGQRLKVSLGVGVGPSGVEWFTRGWYVIDDARKQGDAVTVEAVGLLHLIHEARMVTPFQPSGTLASTLRGLVEPALTVDIDPALVDRAVPSGINWSEDRLGAVNEVLDAWAAEAYVHEEGYLAVLPANRTQDPVLTLTNGTGGTVIEATGSSTREGAYNVVVAKGTAADGGEVQGVVYDTLGPKAYGGDFNPLAVPFFFFSPLLTTKGECLAAATTIRDRKRREAGRSFTAEIVPHPGLQAGDRVVVTTDDYADLLCSIEGLRLPYTADGGAMGLSLREVLE